MDDLEQLTSEIERFISDGQTGRDPVAARHASRRNAWSLFTPVLADEEIEALRPYIFAYERLPETPDDEPVRVRNFIDGEWRDAARSAPMPAKFDRRVMLCEMAASDERDVRAALDVAERFWLSLEWTTAAVTYRKWVVQNLSRILEYFREECLAEIRHQIPKTRIEAEKDFWEAKRAADHLGGSAVTGMEGELLPSLVGGHTYWRNDFIPAGICAVITPMNFIYGIPGIQIVGCYLSGSPFIFKGHPDAAITNTTLTRMMMAAGADPRVMQKLEGFGKGITSLATDRRVKVVSVTGSDETALAIQKGRGLGRVVFEGGGVNWAFIDNGFSDAELRSIATRLSYSKLGFSSHKCSTLHGVCGPASVIEPLAALMNEEFDGWTIKDPRTAGDEEKKILGPVMVHKAQTISNIRDAARAAGVPIVRDGGMVTDGDYAANAEVVEPLILGPITPETELTCDWDGKGERTFRPAITEFFQPVLCTMHMESFDEFLRFALATNPYDLIVSIWSRDDSLIQRGRKVLGGMLKENDGTDSALEWEAFGASGVGLSGNTGVGEPRTTIAMFCRKQKGRHLVFDEYVPARGDAGEGVGTV
ncbi:MAG: aldehyde dehydrogenase family protein [Longimicrobiales bacterium]